MKKAKALTIFLYNHHVIRYLFVGGTTFCIDFGLLVTLHGFMNIWLPLSTSVAYTVAVTYNFSLNRWWTFSAAESKSVREHIVPYIILLGFNMFFTVTFVSLASHYINYAVAKVFAVGIQISWTYYIYRNIIFTTEPKLEQAPKTTS